MSGTTIDVDSLQVTALSDAITFAGATIDGNSVWFSGTESAGFPLPVGQRVMIKVNGGSVDADYFEMTGNFVAEADARAERRWWRRLALPTRQARPRRSCT